MANVFPAQWAKRANSCCRRDTGGGVHATNRVWAECVLNESQQLLYEREHCAVYRVLCRVVVSYSLHPHIRRQTDYTELVWSVPWTIRTSTRVSFVCVSAANVDSTELCLWGTACYTLNLLMRIRAQGMTAIGPIYNMGMVWYIGLRLIPLHCTLCWQFFCLLCAANLAHLLCLRRWRWKI